MSGIWTSTPTLLAGETWIHYMLVQHPGLVVFLVMDAVVFIAATTLTITQTSMVIAYSLSANNNLDLYVCKYIRENYWEELFININIFQEGKITSFC